MTCQHFISALGGFAQLRVADSGRQTTIMSTATLPFWLVDVFAREPLTGNGLSLFLLDDDLPASMMQRITREMRQFETIFLTRIGTTSRFETRIFTMEEELLFAGHPGKAWEALVESSCYNFEHQASVNSCNITQPSGFPVAA